jgi:protein transport protein DSL1/ZW10
MSSPPSHEELSQAILQQVQYGAYPESENVASADIPSEALQGLLDAIGKSREGIKVALHDRKHTESKLTV